jgi:hypothetical protein
MPRFGVIPVPELVDTFVGQELGGSEVEPRIELVDNGFVSNDGKYSDQKSQHTDS